MQIQMLVKSNRARVVIGLALVASVLLAGSTANAAGDALVKIGWKARSFGFGTYASLSQAGTAMDFATAQVGATPGTPSVMWAAGQFSGVKQGSYGPYTQYGYPTISSMRTLSWDDKGGALQKSHPGAPAGLTTLMASAVATTSCPGGACSASHAGTFTTSPGAKKYGGSAKFLTSSFGSGTATSSIGGNRTFMFEALGTPNPQVKSNAYVRNTFSANNTSPAFPTPSYFTAQFIIGATYTTGTVMARQSIAATTTETDTGSFALNGANNTGTISVVVPRITFNNLRCQDRFDTPVAAPQTSGSSDGFCDSDGTTAVVYNGTTGASASTSSVSLTFLPEPTQAAMLTVGALSLAGAGARRRRR